MTSGDVVGALDIGGTHVSGGRVNVATASLDSRSRAFAPLPAAAGRAELLAAISKVTRSIAEPGMASLGVSVPGPFDYASGVSQITHKLESLRGIDLRSELHAASALPDAKAIRFLNDAEAFLLGEWWAGAARGHVRAVGITLGTGLGSAFSEEGEIVRSGAGVPPRGELFGVRFRDAPVEQTISRAALLAAYGTPLIEGIDVEQIADRARAGERAARRVFTDLGTALGQFLTPWLRAFEPSCLVVGGSIARSWDLFEGTLTVELEPLPGLRTVTVAAKLEDAPLLGAAFYAAERRPVMAERRLDPQVEAYRRERHAAGARPLHELSVQEARAAELSELEPATPEPVARVLERVAPGRGGEVPVRVYVPEADRPLPVLVYFFGGGWVLGSLAAADPVCRRLANATPCAVVSVAYRRAPENPFPAGLEDCHAATCWVAEHGAELGLDPGRLAVGGASAGGNLAAAVALLARERGRPELAFQLLVYPALDHRADTPSMHEPLDPPFFGREDFAWCWSHYLAEPEDGDNPLASPLRARDLRGLPAALLITAELDPLRDQGELYAARLTEAGVPTELVRFEGAAHGFFSKADRFDAAAEAQALAAAALRRAFEPPAPSNDAERR